MTLQEIFIRNLKFYRKQKGLTQNDLTLSIDKSYNYINGVEQKKCFPPLDVIERIADALGVKAYQLFMEDGCPENAMQFNADKYIEKKSPPNCIRALRTTSTAKCRKFSASKYSSSHQCVQHEAR